jgi:hypothetical protein
LVVGDLLQAKEILVHTAGHGIEWVGYDVTYPLAECSYPHSTKACMHTWKNHRRGCLQM